MSVRIYVPSYDIWSFFQENRARCKKEMVAIAENTDTEYAIYVTEDDGYPLFSVCKGDKEPEYEEKSVGSRDCADVAKLLFAKYLFPVNIRCEKAFSQDNYTPPIFPVGEKEYDEVEDEIGEREEELRHALCEFLQIVLQTSGDCDDIPDTYGEEMISDVLESILEYLGRQHGLGGEIYRPTVFFDEDCAFFTEYPYDPDADYEEIEDESDETEESKENEESDG